jgi:hypothetical protein
VARAADEARRLLLPVAAFSLPFRDPEQTFASSVEQRDRRVAVVATPAGRLSIGTLLTREAVS